MSSDYPTSGSYPGPGDPAQGYPPPGQGYPPQGGGYPQYPQGQGYAQAGYGGPARSYGGGMATAALILGIIALLGSETVILGVLLGLLAVIFGFIAARRASRYGAPGRGRAIAGIVTGAIGLILAVLLVVVGVSLLNSKAGKNYQSCLNHATTSAQRNACARQFVNNLGS